MGADLQVSPHGVAMWMTLGAGYAALHRHAALPRDDGRSRGALCRAFRLGTW
jgi:hypothetical protein